MDSKDAFWSSLSITYNRLLANVSHTYPKFMMLFQCVSESLNDLVHLDYPRSVHYVYDKPIDRLFDTIPVKYSSPDWTFIPSLFIDLDSFFAKITNDFSHSLSLALQKAIFNNLKKYIKKIRNEMNMYHKCAITIQKAFRGFLSRKSICLHNPHTELGRLYLLRLFPESY